MLVLDQSIQQRKKNRRIFVFVVVVIIVANNEIAPGNKCNAIFSIVSKTVSVRNDKFAILFANDDFNLNESNTCFWII